jgi:hypothetical protein
MGMPDFQKLDKWKDTHKIKTRLNVLMAYLCLKNNLVVILIEN